MSTRPIIFLILISLAVGTVVYALVSAYSFQGSMMDHGMGTTNIWAPFVAVPLTFLLGLMAYIVLFPEIEQKPSAEKVLRKDQQTFTAVLRVLKEDERKVVEALMNTNGTMLQRDIARQTGFSRVKTHRILYRLASRGIVTAKKHYNTYQISLADWLEHKE